MEDVVTGSVSGYGSGYGSGDGSGDGSGYGSGYGYGYGNGSGSESERLKIEMNILKNIPIKNLPLFIGIWEFDETKTAFSNKLKRSLT